MQIRTLLSVPPRLAVPALREPDVIPELNTGSRIVAANVFRRLTKRTLILCAAVLGTALAPAAAEAKGCIKGAVVGGLAGHMAGHGKIGAVAGCVIGRHEANKQDAQKGDQKAPPSTGRDNHI